MEIKETFELIQKKYEGKYPVPIIAIATDLNIKVYTTNSLKDIESGALIKEGEDFVIYVNSRHPVTRQLFTIAHELGHYVNDQDYFDTHTEIVDTYRQLNRSEGCTSPDLRQRDVAANKFAANLLMPDSEFTKIWHGSQNIEQVAKYFNVSVSAATIRAKDLLGSMEY